MPNYTEALNNRGVTLHELKRFIEALANFDHALAIQPSYAEALNNRGNALHALKQFTDALASYEKALIVRPNYAEALYNRGNTLHALKRFAEALASFSQALTLRPDHAETLNNQGLTLHAMKRLAEARANYEQALTLQPNHFAALNNLGNVLRDLKRLKESLARIEQALMLRPGSAEALISRGATLRELKRFAEAFASFAQAQELQPDFADAHWEEALLRLLTGDLSCGWAKYEWRWETDQQRNTKRNFPQPLWHGAETIDGKTIFLHGEQGLGDTIQFCRYAPLVAARGARVILEVEKPLRELMAGLAGATAVVSRGDPLPDFDLHCPLASLPLAFATRLETIPSNIPYLSVPEAYSEKWEQRLPKSASPRVGITWAGNPNFINDHNRSIALHALLPLLDAKATFVSLQKDVRPDDAEVLKERSDILQFGAAIKDFADTAALVSRLDLVISVDTGVAHLAGALARPVWVLLPFIPDWRWLLDRNDSPWYPTARLFRQDDRREWDGVIQRVQDALRDFTENHSKSG
jgi:tetratricopeptide (TPR) repeat protein